jgi:predicted ATP-grasp superfamily ATP-dependent carboligase
MPPRTFRSRSGCRVGPGSLIRTARLRADTSEVNSQRTPTRVLVAVDEGTGALAAVRALRRAGYEPWAAYHQRSTYATRSRAVAGRLRVPNPEDGADAYATALAQAADASGAAVVIPASESALHALTGRQERFAAGVVVGVTSQEALDRATDKAALEGHAAAAGLRTPRSATLARGDELGPAVAIGFPALVKPAQSVTAVPDGGLQVRDAVLVRDKAALAEAVLAAPGSHVVVQRHVQGGLAAISGVAWNGEVVCASHQITHRIWQPPVGVTCMGETVRPDLELEEAVRRLIARLGWSGIFQTQFIRGAEGAFLIDVNPRVYGSLALAVAAGANLPAIWVDLLLGHPPRPAEARAGRRYRVEEDDPRALLRLFRAGRRREALAGFLPRPGTVHAVFSLRDPRPSAVTVSKLLGRAAHGRARQTSRAISAQSSSRGRSASSTRTSNLSDSSR